VRTAHLLHSLCLVSSPESCPLSEFFILALHNPLLSLLLLLLLLLLTDDIGICTRHNDTYEFLTIRYAPVPFDTLLEKYYVIVTPSLPYLKQFSFCIRILLASPIDPRIHERRRRRRRRRRDSKDHVDPSVSTHASYLLSRDVAGLGHRNP
jgi:hypothetical protein